jgi:hypothetical protein
MWARASLIQFTVILFFTFTVVSGKSQDANEPLDQKLCVLQSAQKLPTIAGLEIRNVSVKTIDRNIFIPRISQTIFSERQARDLINELGILDGRLDGEIRRAPDYSELVSRELNKYVSVTFELDIEFSAAKRIASIRFHCAKSASDSVRSYVLGIVR